MAIRTRAAAVISDMRRSQANDPMRMDNGKMITTTDHNGGIRV